MSTHQPDFDIDDPTTTPNTANYTGIFLHCNPEERLWYIFFLSSVFSFVGALILVSVGRCLMWLYSKHSQRTHQRQKVNDQQRNLLNSSKHADIGCVTAAKDWAGELISGQTNSGRILVININSF